jgi:hypothetical protein
MSFALPGVLDVLVDGKPIFSLEAEGRLPGRGEIARLIRASSQP